MTARTASNPNKLSSQRCTATRSAPSNITALRMTAKHHACAMASNPLNVLSQMVCARARPASGRCDLSQVIADMRRDSNTDGDKKQ
ncbi:hypothetical protein [Chromatium okenii]|uniref:hypothetical protein n=1 Tax=Chromatium okenii TaxID=61644 RepID=UPI001F5B3677|nr:hypothetical protein [Chromatium okenii]